MVSTNYATRGRSAGEINYQYKNHFKVERHASSGDQIEKNEMGRACSKYGGRGEFYIGFWWENLRERDHLKDPGADGRITVR